MVGDYHTHTYRSGHGSGTLHDYIESAIQKGLDEIALTDHLYLYYEPEADRDPTLAMAEEEFPVHYQEMIRVRAAHSSSIVVRVSVEADWVSGADAELERILSLYELDFVLGGVHFVEGWLVDAPQEADRYDRIPVEEIYGSYFREVRAAAESDLFDVLAHFDLPKKFGHRPPEAIKPVILETLECVKESGCALEVSTVGLRDPIREPYPAPWIVEQMRRMEIPIVLSSDAHSPAEVGYDFDGAIQMVRAAGYREVVSFDAGTAILRPLG